MVLIKISCLIYTIIFTSASVVTLAYYSVGYQESESLYEQISDLHRHGLNWLVVVVDLYILSYPVSLLHYVYIFLFFLIYIFFTIVYWLVNPKQNIIYSQLDYNNPIGALFHVSLSFFLSLIVHIIHFLLAMFKNNLNRNKNIIIITNV
jgi:hypothetical protein